MKRPYTHAIGELGEAIVQAMFIEHGWIVSRPASDYGYDLYLQHLEPGGGMIFALLQVKALAAPISAKGKSYFTYKLEVRHLEHWDKTPQPVYLCVVDVPGRNTFVVSIQDLISGLKSRYGQKWGNTKTRAVQLPYEAALTSSRFAELLQEIREWWTPVIWLKQGYSAIPENPPYLGQPLDSLLSTPKLFELVSTRAPRTVELIARYCYFAIVAKESQQEELQGIQAELQRMPPLDEHEIRRWVEETLNRSDVAPYQRTPRRIKHLIEALWDLGDRRITGKEELFHWLGFAGHTPNPSLNRTAPLRGTAG